MPGSAAALSTLNRFSNGRRLFVLKQVLGLAEAIANPELVTCAQWALTHERETRKLERRWRKARGNRSKGRGEAAVLDVQLDRVIGAMHSALQALLPALDPRSAHAAMVRSFIDNYFPEGADAITGAEHEDALAIIEEMNEDFAVLSAADQEKLSVTYHVSEIARLGPLFSAELNRPSLSMRFDTLRAARVEGHERLCELTATIIALYRGREPAQLDARAQLLEPILDANQRVTARRKRRNGPDVEVDPNTGEELEDGQDLVAEDGVDEGEDVVSDPLVGGPVEDGGDS